MASIEKDRYHGQSFNQLLGIKAFSLVGFPEDVFLIHHLFIRDSQNKSMNAIL